MYGFKTKSGTEYIVNQTQKTIQGGMFTEPVLFTELSCVIGERARAVLADKRVLETTPVVEYI